MSFPRAIMGQVRCMARPARPPIEGALVREAAEIVRTETGLTSARAVSREIARRVVAEFMADLETDPLDLAFAAVERTLEPSSFHRLASCPEINLCCEFVDNRSKRLEARGGRYLSSAEQVTERKAIAAELLALLSARYDKHIRSNR